MAIGSGIGGQFSIAEEVTYGTVATPARHLRLISYETIPARDVVNVMGIAAGRLGPIDEIVTKQWGTVKVVLQAPKRGLGMLLRQIFGGTVVPVQQAATTAYKQSLIAADNRGRMLSMQGGFPNIGGTASAFTALGAKATKFSIKCAAGEVATIEMEFFAREISEAPGLVTWADQPQSVPFAWPQLTVGLGTFGAEAAVPDVVGFELSIERSLDIDGSFTSGNAGRMVEPNMNDWLVVTGTTDVTFGTKANFVDRANAHTTTSMAFTFVGDVIASTFSETLKFTVPKPYFKPAGMAVPDNGVLKFSLGFDGFNDLTNGMVTCDYTSLDTAV